MVAFDMVAGPGETATTKKASPIDAREIISITLLLLELLFLYLREKLTYS